MKKLMYFSLLAMTMALSSAWAGPELSIPSGTRADLPPGAIATMSAWCNNTMLQLARSRQDAQVSLAYGDYAAAEQTLRQGLMIADQAGAQFRRNGPITSRAIFRGIQLSDALAVATAQAHSGARSRTYFLFEYYDFVTDVVQNLDLPLYLPYRECALCGRVNATLFEERFVEYARRQVQMVLSTLAEENRGYYEPRITPVGAPAAYLKALEISTGYAAMDLQDSLWGSRYACVIGSLMTISQKLAQFNAHVPGSYYDEVDAVNRSYIETHQALHAMCR